MSTTKLLRQESAAWKAKAERAATEMQALRMENEALKKQQTMHMYVWSDEVSFMAIAQADSVQKARILVLDQIGTDDGSCPEQAKARRMVEKVNPSIWYGNNAEFCLRDSAEAREQEAYASTLFAQNEALKKRLENATEFVFHRPSPSLRGRAIRLRMHSDGKWGTCYVTEGSAFPLFSDGKNLFDTFEEAEAAARKAMEVHG